MGVLAAALGLPPRDTFAQGGHNPAALSRSLLPMFDNEEDVPLLELAELVSNALFEGECVFALSFNQFSVKSYLDGFTALKWMCYGAQEPSTYKRPRTTTGDKDDQEDDDHEPRCGEIWKGQHVAYRCLTCGISENSCMCLACWSDEDHVGHDYRIYSSTVGGCCDCGDDQAWRSDGFCKRHSKRTEERPLDALLVRRSTQASLVVVFHLWRCLHRLLQRGMDQPQDSASAAPFQVMHCLRFFTELASSRQRECRLAVCQAFSTQLSSSPFAALANATSRSLYLDNLTMTEILLNVCGLLPHGLAKDAELLFLKLIMEQPDYKLTFQTDFCVVYPKLLQGLRECNQNYYRGNGNGNDQQHGSSQQRIHPRPNLVRAVHYQAKPEDMFASLAQIVDGLYCQLFHNEELSVQHAPNVLLYVFAMLAHPQASLKYGFYSRAFSHAHALLCFPSICRIVLESETLFLMLVQCATQAQLAVERVKNEGDIFPFFSMLEDFVLRPLREEAGRRSRYRVGEEEWQWPALESAAQLLYGKQLPGSIHVPLTRFYLLFSSSSSPAATIKPELARPCLLALQEHFSFEHAKNAGMGTMLAARYKRGFLALDLRACLRAAEASSGFLQSLLELAGGFQWESMEHELRFWGALLVQAEEEEEKADGDALRRRLVHAVACQQPCAFSELDTRGGGEADEEAVMRVLTSIATSTAASSVSGMSAAKAYSLKPQVWDEVEFGGFYLAWTLKDEEQAMQAYARAAPSKQQQQNYFPIATRFKRPVSASAVRALGEANVARVKEVCRAALVQQQQQQQPVVVVDAGCKTMALLLLKMLGEIDKEEEEYSTWDTQGVSENLVRFCVGGGGGGEKQKEEEQPAAAAATNPAQNAAQARALKLLAKKQRQFAHKLKKQEGEEDAAAAKEEDERLCVFCKCPGGGHGGGDGEDGEEEDELHLLVLRKHANAPQAREMVFWQGQSRAVAVSELPQQRISVDASIVAESVVVGEDPSPRAAPADKPWQTRFFAHLQHARGELNNSHVEHTVLHTCQHAAHLSCLETYHQSLTLRRQRKERYEGEGIIALELGELVCPVCRRVANDVMPLCLGNSNNNNSAVVDNEEEEEEEWFRKRFEDPPSLSAVVGTPSSSPRASFTDFSQRYECLAELVVAQLEVDSSALDNLWRLCLENRRGSTSSSRETWQNFACKRFGPAAAREGVLCVDLVLVLVEWLFVDDDAAVDRAFRFLLPFARLQDVVFDCLTELASGGDGGGQPTSLFTGEYDEPALERALGWFVEKARREEEEDSTTTTTTFAPALVAQIVQAALVDGGDYAQAKSALTALLLANNNNRSLPLGVVVFPRSGDHRRESFEQRFIRLGERLVGRKLLLTPAVGSAQTTTTRACYSTSLAGWLKLALQPQPDAGTLPASDVLTADVANQLRVWSLLPPVLSFSSASSSSSSTLIALPALYSSLTVAFLGRQSVCTQCLLKPDNPALCLQCGKLLCLRSACCHTAAGRAQGGGGLDEFLLDEVFTHSAEQCSRGGGRAEVSSSLFLMLKNGAVLVILSEARFSLFGTLYLDAHEEEDLVLARGKPLMLSEERVQRLELLQTTQTWFQDSRFVDSIRVLAFPMM